MWLKNSHPETGRQESNATIRNSILEKNKKNYGLCPVYRSFLDCFHTPSIFSTDTHTHARLYTQGTTFILRVS